jgi:cytoskeletal protein CcmA (bactofilin family)
MAELGGGVLLSLAEVSSGFCSSHLLLNRCPQATVPDSAGSWVGSVTGVLGGRLARIDLLARTNLKEERWHPMAMDPGKASSTYIGKGTRISGKVDFGEKATIDGEAEGEITGDDIEIAPSALVMARITAKRLKISGQVDGEIIAHERVELLETARLRCTITTPTLVISEGAHFDGDCKMPRGIASSPQSESHEAKEAGVSFFITQAQRAKLLEHGYSGEDIAQMLPAIAHRILGLQ